VGLPSWADVRREMAYSASTLAILAAVNATLLALFVSGVIEIYVDPLKHGLAWLLLSLPVTIVLHDAYFYWVHRLLHHPWMFRRVHGVHHRSRNPSPWAALAFHPVEGLINSLALPLILLVLPLHEWVVVGFAVHQIVRGTHGHASIETLPHGFARHWLGGRFTTTTHHHLHHETARGNYGLWFTWWDRWFGTERPEYLDRFDAATQPRPTPAADRAEAVA
jgi:sterol desaturase/sphingolipid hydroxylase (fatty acid hydroxylase superfamily)